MLISSCLFGLAINAYSGIMGSGKSYEVVAYVIIPVLQQGRRVVTNISGINNDLIRQYVSEKYELPLDKVGHVFSISTDNFRDVAAFPFETPDGVLHDGKFVNCGDLIAADEMYKIWGKTQKLQPQHLVFFREHRHFTHPETGVSCDIVFMTQDIGDIHRDVKVVLELNFKCHKAKSIGRDNLYTVTMWEGYKQAAKHIVSDWTKIYNPEIFPLYKSYSGDKQGKELASDSRQNILTDKRLIYKTILMVIFLACAIFYLYHYFSSKVNPKSSSPNPVTGQPLSTLPAPSPKNDYSTDWRIVGTVSIGGVQQIVLSSPEGIRLDEPLNYRGSGLQLVGLVDGKKVTRFSGTLPVAPTKKDSLIP